MLGLQIAVIHSVLLCNTRCSLNEQSDATAHLCGWCCRLLINSGRLEVVAEFVDVLFFFGCFIYKWKVCLDKELLCYVTFVCT